MWYWGRSTLSRQREMPNKIASPKDSRGCVCTSTWVEAIFLRLDVVAMGTPVLDDPVALLTAKSPILKLWNDPNDIIKRDRFRNLTFVESVKNRTIWRQRVDARNRHEKRRIVKLQQRSVGQRGNYARYLLWNGNKAARNPLREIISVLAALKEASRS